MLKDYRAAIEAFLARYSIPSPWALDLVDTVTLTAGGLSFLCFLLFLLRNLPARDQAHDRPARVLLRRAYRAEKKGNHREAAELFMAARSYKEAAKAYVRVEDYAKASEACLAISDFGNAAKCLMRIGDHAGAAALFVKAKEYLLAAENLLLQDNFYEAAPLFVRGGQPVRAAECYARAGFTQKAGELLAEAGENQKAAVLLSKSLSDHNARRDSSVKAEEDAVAGNLADAASECLLKSGEKLKAAVLLESGNRPARAAALYEELGEKGKASELYIRAQDTAAAARVLESSDHPQEGGLRVAEALLSEGKKAEAAAILGKLGEWKRAAPLLLECGLKERAAEAFRACGDLAAASKILIELDRSSEAASLLMAAGRAHEAAEIFRSLGQREQEIEALLKGGAFYSAGRNLIALGRVREALEALQRVESSSGDFANANRVLGDLFFEQGQHSLAISSYQKSIAGENVTRESIDSFYRFACALRDDGQLQAAASLFEKILLVDYHFRDARDQLQILKAKLGSSHPGSSGQFLHRQGADPNTTLAGDAARQDKKAGRYQIIEEIGRGGMGVVYRAKDTLLDRIVAYKVLPPQVKRNKQVTEMFLREARSAARLSHPNIVTIYDADEAAGEYFIIMELVEGSSLKDLLEKQGRFPQKSALVLIGQVMKALSYAHGRGIVHRDIKPANLLWSRAEKLVKVTDFGLARIVEEGRRTHTQMAGTPYYMAPEQILGGKVDHRADVYAIGVTLYEFLTGTVPFREGDVLYHHCHTPPPPPETRDLTLAGPMSALIMKCLEKDPEKRYPTVDAAFERLKGLLV